MHRGSAGAALPADAIGHGKKGPDQDLTTDVLETRASEGASAGTTSVGRVIRQEPGPWRCETPDPPEPTRAAAKVRVATKDSWAERLQGRIYTAGKRESSASLLLLMACGRDMRSRHDPTRTRPLGASRARGSVPPPKGGPRSPWVCERVAGICVRVIVAGAREMRSRHITHSSLLSSLFLL